MKLKIRNWIGGILFFFSLIHICVSFYFSTITAVWFDEIYSMVFAFRPARELVAFTARDVHPPLYYLILRFFLLIFDKLFPFIEAEQVGKIVSIIPYILIMVYAITIIRKKWGMFVSGLFVFCLCYMPEIMYKTVEIRMYSWSLFCITGLGIHFVNIIMDFFDKKKISIINFAAIFIYTVAALYLHYFAAIAVFWIYFASLMIILFRCIKQAKQGIDSKSISLKYIGSLIVTGIVSIICYIPWISIVLSQVSAVKESYWISPLGLKTPFNTAMFLFKARYNSEIIATVLALVLIGFLAFLLYRKVKKALTGDDKSIISIYIFSILPLVALTGYLLSLIIRPIFLDRYLEPSMGLFWFAICIFICDYLNDVINEENQKRYKVFAGYCALCIIVLNAIADATFYYPYETNIKEKETQFHELLSTIDEDTILITNLDHVQGIVSYLKNTDRRVFKPGQSFNQIGNYNIYLYIYDEKPLLSETLPGFDYIVDGAEIRKYVDEGKKVLLLNYVPSLIDIPANLKEEYSLNCVPEGSYLYEHYNIDVYSVEE